MSTFERPALIFDLVSKSFPRHANRMLVRDRIVHLVRGRHRERIQALQEISFTVRHGETVGIIGHNGAGKSTLLNMATGLCRPDSGRIEVNGRVAALLELGSGFHPDLTGAENLSINAALLGVSRKRAALIFDEVVSFSELGDFINEPLRTYSSGMVMRLAFSVAVHTDPDILIVDEVLAVGDLAFSNKCIHKTMEIRDAGKTLICVSHVPQTVTRLCSRAIWLDHGRIVDDGPAAEIMAAYQASQIGQHAVQS